MATTTRPRPGRPAKTSTTAILDAAEQVGLKQLTRAAVAEQLGVSAATVRHHVESADRLYSLACARVFERLDLVADAASWQDYLLTIGERFAELVETYPGVEDYVLRGPYERSTLDRFERIMTEVIDREPSMTRPMAHLLGSRMLTLAAAMPASTLDRRAPETAPAAAAPRAVREWTLRATILGAAELIARGDIPATIPTPDAAWTHAR